MDYWEKPEKNGICICEGNSPETVIFPRLLFNLCVSRKYMGNILLSTKTTYNNLPEERNAGVMALPCKIYTLQTHDFHELPQIPRFSFQDQEKKQNLRTRKGAVSAGYLVFGSLFGIPSPKYPAEMPKKFSCLRLPIGWDCAVGRVPTRPA